VTFLNIRSAEGDEYVTVIRNTAYSNMTALFKADKHRLPDEDTISVIPGFVGAYPNAFAIVERSALPDYINAVSNLQTETDYETLVDNWGVRRTDDRFWSVSDNTHVAFQKDDPIEFGRFDYNRLENR
jgi:hypothetical protein